VRQLAACAELRFRDAVTHSLLNEFVHAIASSLNDCPKLRLKLCQSGRVLAGICGELGLNRPLSEP
jgi:hypothetical protein